MSTEIISGNGPVTADGLPEERRTWAAAAIFIALAMASLDTAIANIALPAIAAGLHASPADVIWVVNAYQIAMVATLLPLAAFGEVVGHHRIYLGGLLLFTLASLFCACVVIAQPADGARAAGPRCRRHHEREYGAGSFRLSGALGKPRFRTQRAGRCDCLHARPDDRFKHPLDRVVELAVCRQHSLRRCRAVLRVGLRTLPRTPRATHAFDFPGALMAAGCLGLFILGVGSAAHHARPGLVSIELASAVLLGWVLIRRQADSPAPVLPVDLFRRPIFALSTATAICSFAVQGLAFVSLPFYFEDILGRSQVETGFFMTPWPLVVAIMAPIAGRLSDRHPAGILGGFGLALLGLGMALLAMLPANPHVIDIVWRMAICGSGFGFFQAPNMKALMSSAPADRSGSASGVVATARLTGQTAGAALAALCFGLVGREGATLALVLGAVFAALGCGMSVLRLVAAPRSGDWASNYFRFLLPRDEVD